MAKEKDVFRLIFYIMLSLLALTLFQILARYLIENIDSYLLFIFISIITYGIISTFSILLLNGLEIHNVQKSNLSIQFESPQKSELSWYGAFIFLYMFFLIGLASFVQSYLFHQYHLGFDSLDKFGLINWIVVIYGTCLFIIYARMSEKLRKFKWI
jgi:hypothetical protein